MSDIKVNNLGNVLGPVLKKRGNGRRISLTYSNDTFKKSPFDIENAMRDLESIIITENGIDNQKFKHAQLKEIKKELEKAPEKWVSIKQLAHVKNIDSETVILLSMQDKDILDAMIPYASEPCDNGQGMKYDLFDIMKFSCTAKDIGADKFVNAKPLIKTKLSRDNIIDIVSNPALQGKMNKVALKVLDMQKVFGDNLKNITFNKNTYNNKEYTIQVETFDKQINTELLDSKLQRSAIDRTILTKYDDGHTYQIRKTKDFKNNVMSKVCYLIDDKGIPNIINEVRAISDKSGKLIRREYTSLSEVPGVFDIKHVDANGKETIISSGKRNPKTGVVTVKKEMESVDGTKTSYLYEDDPEGNRISDYKITDKNGKVLLNNSKTFEVVEENKFITSKNKEKYEITVDNHNINVVDMNKPERKAKISIDKSILGNKTAIIKTLKQMPGEELFKIAQSTKVLFGLNNDDPVDSYYAADNKSIYSRGDLFVILHELGHAVDMKDYVSPYRSPDRKEILDTISRNEEVQQIFNKEKKAFNKAFPNAQRNHIDYFINKDSHYNGELGGLTEAIAESNAILNTPKAYGTTSIRTQYLQQYFPKTIAKIDKALSEKIK